MKKTLKGLRVTASAVGIAVLAQGLGGLILGPLADATNGEVSARVRVHVRTQPTTSSKSLTVLSVGQTLSAHGSKDGWTEVTYNGRTAYVASAYLVGGSAQAGAPTSAQSNGTTTASKGTVYSTVTLNLRSGPSTKDSIGALVQRGTRMELTGTVSGDWAQLTFNGKTYWAAARYLSGTAASAYSSLPMATGKAQAAPTAPAVPKTTLRYATTVLNIWAASTGTRYNGEIPRGGELQVTGIVQNGRAQIVRNGEIRWVTARYVSSTPPASSGGGASAGNSGNINKGYSSGLEKTNANVQAIAWDVWGRFPQIKTQYGWRRDVTPDHPAGRAVDVMIPSYKSNQALGWEIANYYRANAAKFNINYIIFGQKIWSVQRNKEGWRSMASRGNDTANHYDHVHINTYG